MTITVNAASPGANAALATTLLVPYPAGVSAGDLMRLTVTTNDNSATAATVPSGWTLVDEFCANAGANAPSIMVCIKFATGSESGNLSVTTASAKSWGQITAYGGVDATTPQDATHTTKDQTTAATSVAIPGITTVTAGAVLDYSAGQAGAGVTATPPSGFTEDADNGTSAWSGTTGHETLASPGSSGTVTVGFSGSNRGVGILIALRPASAPAPAPSSEFLMFSN